MEKLAALAALALIGFAFYSRYRSPGKTQGETEYFEFDYGYTSDSFDEFLLGDDVSENIVLTYFQHSEFGEWWPHMNRELLVKLDNFRDLLGVPVMISPASGSLGRHGGGESRHNIDRWGEVQAVDVMFSGVDLEYAYQVAREVGFTGIGAYPMWKPYPGLHLDVRPGRVATWAGLLNENGDQFYTGVDRAFV